MFLLENVDDARLRERTLPDIRRHFGEWDASSNNFLSKKIPSFTEDGCVCSSQRLLQYKIECSMRSTEGECNGRYIYLIVEDKYSSISISNPHLLLRMCAEIVHRHMVTRISRRPHNGHSVPSERLTSPMTVRCRMLQQYRRTEASEL